MTAGNQEGSVTLWLVLLSMAMMAAVGLVFDGGRAMATKGQAIADAYGAARAGAEAMDRAGFIRGGAPTPDPGTAVVAARDFLVQAGVGPAQASIAVNGPEVAVIVHLRSPATILGAVGVGPFDVSAQGRARAVYGVRGPRP
jgi:hypothetical protein